VPLSATTDVPPVVESLLIASWPVTDPEVVGLNWTVNDVDWPGFKVAGRLPETIVKPLPEIDAAFTVKAELP